jgi:hypothetical protein
VRLLKLQVLLLVLAVVVVATLAADVVLKNRAETELAHEVAARAPGTTGVDAKISSFPFVGRLLLSGTVPKVVVTAQHTSVAEVSLDDIRIEVDDVTMDSGAARQGKAVVQSIRRGSVQADLRQDQINSRLPRGYQVQLQAGKAALSGPNAGQAQLVTTPEGSVQLRAANRSLFDLPFPKTDLLPCAPTATFVGGAVRLTCTFDRIPPLLANLAKR